MRALKQIGIAALVIFLAAQAARAETGDFQRQLVTLPANVESSRFADVNGDGRLDLLAVDPVERKLLIYRQRASGFTNAPDQSIELPKQTVWIAPFEVDAHPGVELLMSTAAGLVYLRQNDGRFESEPRTLVPADQVFTDDISPRLISLTGFKGRSNAVIPVISATQGVEYRRNEAFGWSHGPAIALELKRTGCYVNGNEWMMGAASSYSLRVQQFFRASTNEVEMEESDNDGIKKLLEELEKDEPRHSPETSRVDVNGDGREDLVVWQIVGEMETRTDVYVFLRGADGQFPQRPTQVLHCRGFPIPNGSSRRAAPVGDLKGDGSNQLVLLEIKGALASTDSLLDMALSQGLDWVLTIRSFNHGAFSRGSDAAITVKAVVPMEWQPQPVVIGGDFNGDGRPDLVVRRSTTRWNIILSTNDGRWFESRPALTFETPVQGSFEFNDLNGDGRSDIVLRAWDEPRLFIFRSQPQRTKGRSP